MAAKKTGLRVRYVTKSGEVFENNYPLWNRSFAEFYRETIEKRDGLFSVNGGKMISIDALLRVEEVEQ